jgi:hypothetical protein
MGAVEAEPPYMVLAVYLVTDTAAFVVAHLARIRECQPPMHLDLWFVIIQAKVWMAYWHADITARRADATADDQARISGCLIFPLLLVRLLLPIADTPLRFILSLIFDCFHVVASLLFTHLV